MQISVQNIAVIVNGTVDGEANLLIDRPSKIEEGGVGSITFLANPKYENFIYTTTASAVLVNKNFQPSQKISATLIRVDDVYGAIALLLEKFGNTQATERQISAQAFVHPKAVLGNNIAIGHFSVIEEGVIIGDDVLIYPQVYIGKGVKIGKGCILYPGVKVYADCQIGMNSILHSNVIIGSDGFGFAPQKDGSYRKISQIGQVIIEENVEIGANTVIDRATMGATIIKKGVKLDNLIQIAHNVEIGENTVIAAQAGIAGSTKIGQNCRIGGQAGFVGHIQVADGAMVQAQSGVAASIKKENTAVYGSPALGYSEYLRAYAVFKKLPELYRKINALERRMADSGRQTTDD